MQNFNVKAQVICEKISWIGFHSLLVEAPDSDSAISQAQNILKDWGRTVVRETIVKRESKIEIQLDDIEVKITLLEACHE